MQFEHQAVVAAPIAQVWALLMDVQRVVQCMDGVEALDVQDDDHYSGSMQVKMGPVKLTFSGDVAVLERNAQTYLGRLEATAHDRKAGGGFKAQLAMRLTQQAATETLLQVELSTDFLGRIGQLGRPLIKRKVESMLADFSNKLGERCHAV